MKYDVTFIECECEFKGMKVPNAKVAEFKKKGKKTKLTCPDCEEEQHINIKESKK